MNAADRASALQRTVLTATLFALVALYAFWFREDRDRLAAWLVFALPPLLLGLGVLARRAQARFWAGVCALLWFSHGVMAAWTQPDHRWLALAEIALSLVVVFAASAAGLRARFGRRSTS